jgi:hypothetical protein
MVTATMAAINTTLIDIATIADALRSDAGSNPARNAEGDAMRDPTERRHHLYAARRGLRHPLRSARQHRRLL